MGFICEMLCMLETRKRFPLAGFGEKFEAAEFFEECYRSCVEKFEKENEEEEEA